MTGDRWGLGVGGWGGGWGAEGRVWTVTPAGAALIEVLSTSRAHATHIVWTFTPAGDPPREAVVRHREHPRGTGAVRGSGLYTCELKCGACVGRNLCGVDGIERRSAS